MAASLQAASWGAAAVLDAHRAGLPCSPSTRAQQAVSSHLRLLDSLSRCVSTWRAPGNNAREPRTLERAPLVVQMARRRGAGSTGGSSQRPDTPQRSAARVLNRQLRDAMRLAQRDVAALDGRSLAQVDRIIRFFSEVGGQLAGAPAPLPASTIATALQVLAGLKAATCGPDSSRAWAAAGLLELVVQLTAAARAALPALSAAQLAAVAWALARLSYHPGDAFLAALVAQAEARLAGFSAPALSALLWSLAQQGFRLAQPALDAAVAQAEPGLASLAPAQVVDLAWALASQRRSVSQEFLDQLAHVAWRKMQLFSDAQMMQLIWAFAEIGYAPHVEVYEGLLEQLWGIARYPAPTSKWFP